MLFNHAIERASDIREAKHTSEHKRFSSAKSLLWTKLEIGIRRIQIYILLCGFEPLCSGEFVSLLHRLCASFRVSF
jgi:hypothetical protein